MADLRALAACFVQAFPKLDATDRRLALHLYRCLARGRAVESRELAKNAGLPEQEIVTKLRGWPGVYYDDAHRVIGFWGLTIVPMAHQLRGEGAALYAWCAWDTLFLPQLLGATLEVESACRGTCQPVRLTVAPTGPLRAEPAGLALSFLVPVSERIESDVITSFCHYVHFFSSERTARPWLARHTDSFLLSLEEAYELGHRVNRARYGDSLLRSNSDK